MGTTRPQSRAYQLRRVNAYIAKHLVEVWEHFRTDPRTLIHLQVTAAERSAVEKASPQQVGRHRATCLAVRCTGAWPLLIQDPTANEAIACIEPLALEAAVVVGGTAPYPSEKGHRWVSDPAGGVLSTSDGCYRHFACQHCPGRMWIADRFTWSAFFRGETSEGACLPRYSRCREFLVETLDEPPCPKTEDRPC